MNNFYYALSLLNTLYGIDMEEDDFAEIAMIGYRLIGNKKCRTYRYTVCVDNCANGVELPCNVDEIEAVTYLDYEEWNHSTNDTPNGKINSAFTESYIENRKTNTHPLYISGTFLKYERVGDMLYFDKPYGRIGILYRGEVLGDDNLPEITDKEAVALATYVAYITKYREGLMTNNANIIQLAETLRLKWTLLCDLARTSYYFSQNDWDLVLNAKTSWARKQYNKSHKIYQ